MNEKPTFDFSEDWEEVSTNHWQWVMWDEEGQTVTGWVIDVREEEFSDKTTGEVRKNPVLYMFTENGETVRFILPTDLRYKVDAVNEKRLSAGLSWKNIEMKIIYRGKAKTSKGYDVKTFQVYARKAEMPETEIPELPTSDDDLQINF